MNLLAGFDVRTWHSLSDGADGHHLITPGGRRVHATPTVWPRVEYSPDGYHLQHDMPLWSLCRLGRYWRHSEDPLHDLHRALDLGARRAALLAPLEVQALTSGLPPGRWRLLVETHTWISPDKQPSVRLATLAVPLTVLMQASWLATLMDVENVLVMGHEGIPIPVPSPRHAVLKRLDELRT